MNSATLKVSSIILSVGLFASGCQNMSPGENAALFGALGGAAAGGIARAAGASTAESVAIGLASGAVIGVTTYIIAKRQASERQRRIAEARAQRAYAKMMAERKANPKKKRSRYIAVDTEKDAQSKGEKTVMIWDTQSQEIVGNNVYDVKDTPEVGTTAKFDTYSAEYVGSGA